MINNRKVFVTDPAAKSQQCPSKVDQCAGLGGCAETGMQNLYTATNNTYHDAEAEKQPECSAKQSLTWEVNGLYLYSAKKPLNYKKKKGKGSKTKQAVQRRQQQEEEMQKGFDCKQNCNVQNSEKNNNNNNNKPHSQNRPCCKTQRCWGK